ncbi:hypothetical protein VUR80DRAFT_1664 [Thermomyces stellatus]
MSGQESSRCEVFKTAVQQLRFHSKNIMYKKRNDERRSGYCFDGSRVRKKKWRKGPRQGGRGLNRAEGAGKTLVHEATYTRTRGSASPHRGPRGSDVTYCFWRNPVLCLALSQVCMTIRAQPRPGSFEGWRSGWRMERATWASAPPVSPCLDRRPSLMRHAKGS